MKIANSNARDKSRLAAINVLGLIDGFKADKKIMPSLPPDPGTEIYSAEKNVLKDVFAKDAKEWIKLGRLLREESIEVFVNINKVASRHLAVLATTGSGKSNLLALIMKKIAELNGTLIVFDYHGEYSSLEVKNVKHASPRINPRDLDSEEFADMMDIRENAERQRTLLNEIFSNTKMQEDFWEGLLNQIHLAKNDNSKKRIARRLEEIIERARNSMQKILDPDMSRSLDQIEENKINIFNMLELNERQASIIIAYYLKEILSDRKSQSNKKFSSPVIVAIEEAHAFIPEGFRSKASDVVAKVAREGRKFGVGLIIISQRPSKIDQNVLSQMGSLAISRIIQPRDQSYIMDITEHIPNELLEHLPSLNTGEMLLTGQWITIPSLVKIDAVKEKLAGTDIDAVKEWSKNIEERRMREEGEDLIMSE